MKRLYVIIAVAALFSSCVKEVVEPGMRISGTYAYDDESGLSEQYISFEDGDFLNVNLSETLSYMDNSYWGYKKSYEYERIVKIPYSIQDGNLIVAGKVMGAIELKDDFLYFQGKKYSKVKSFNEELYSSITLPEGTTKTITYEPKEYSVPVTINRPIPAGVVVASTNDFWISEVKVQDGILTFKVSETKVDRDGTILLRYTNAEDVKLSISQRPSTFIKLAENARTVPYAQSSQSVSYSIENPLPDSALEILCTANWVKNIVIGADAITFDVDENPGTSFRTATLTFSYSGAPDVSFTLTQSGAVTTIVPTPSSQSCTYTGGEFSFYFTIDNPRQGIDISAISESAWITDVSISGNKISYKVAENNSAAQRSGSIKLTYGTFATKSFSVTQSGKPVQSITLNKSNLELYAGCSETLTATVNPSDAVLSWSSSNTSIAKVSTSGVITGVAPGIATINVTANDGSGKMASCSVIVLEPTDLSPSISANCYIVSSVGGYKFKTVKGNSSTSVGSVSKAEVLWESFGTSTAPSKGDIISSVSYASNYIIFTTPSTLKNGNAVIAAKDASGNILWSWHIWVCSGYNPASTAQTYYNSAGTMMDRNLGATSATPGDVGALGLLYQWGRKDPFLGGGGISSSTRAASTLIWPSAVWSTSSKGTIAYTKKNPTTYIKYNYNSSNDDWYYTGSSSTDNDRWKSSKTIYDPCPPGWKVPDGGSSGVWFKAVRTSMFSYNWDSTNKGINFSGKFGTASTIWYPAAGYLDYATGSLLSVGYIGRWWSCTPDDDSAYDLHYFSSNTVNLSGSYGRACGQSVRCQKED